jgi:hypothetical protein
MPRQRTAPPATMVHRIAQALAKAEGQVPPGNPERYRRLAIASLQPLLVPSETMVDAAHEAVWFDAEWAINSHRDFRRAVRAMIARAIAEGEGIDHANRPDLPECRIMRLRTRRAPGGNHLLLSSRFDMNDFALLGIQCAHAVPSATTPEVPCKVDAA